MLSALAATAITLLLLGLPFMLVILGALLVAVVFFVPGLEMTMLFQQFLTGFKPAAFAAIPMFILAASIVQQGEAATRLVNFVRAILGHLPGGLPICTSASCTLFGAVSGSTQATVAAIGGTMRPMLLRAGYPDSFTLALIINSSDIAILIPPSVAAIVYGVVTKTSVGKLFLAGIGPGLLVFILFSIYCYFYSRNRNIGMYPKASPSERKSATRKASLLIGFPIIIMGGIYTGVFTPTEAAAVSVAYALLLEGIAYRTLNRDSIRQALVTTGVITAVVYVLIGAGQSLAWFLCYMEIPEGVLPRIFGGDLSALQLVIIINIAYFIACMFVDPVVALYVLSPFYTVYATQAGIDPIWLGALVILQAGIGSATPPFGCDIFTAMVLFKRPYLEVIRGTPPFILILVLASVLLIAFPDIALFIPRHALSY